MRSVFPRLAAAFLLPVFAGGCPGGPAQVDWEVVAEDLPGAVLSVWGGGVDDVWMVGSDPDDGEGPNVMHWDGSSFERLSTGASGDLWWVTGDHSVLWMAGTGGTLLRLDRGDDSFEVMQAPSDETLFGVFAFADDDVWACGGDPEQGAGVIWHYDGASWEAPADLDPATLADFTCFKVWGTTASDVWFVGRGGHALHRTSGGWTSVDVPLGRPLFTVHGEGDLVVAVGGSNSGHIVAMDADAMIDETPAGVVPQLNGVHVGDGFATAVGLNCAVWHRDVAGTWTDAGAPVRPESLHAVWVAPEGDVWAVGGNLLLNPPTGGLLVHYGPPVGAMD